MEIYIIVCITDDVKPSPAPLRSAVRISARARLKSLSQSKHSPAVDGVFNVVVYTQH